MTPEDFAARHPRLYHLTSPEAFDGIQRHGLLSTAQLLDLFEADDDLRAIVGHRRPHRIPLAHPEHGEAMITDNRPLSMRALVRCLDDGLAPPDWLAILNARVFFWPDAAGLRGLLGAKLNRDRRRLVLTFDTRSLLAMHQERVELSPINAGSTIRKPARRGLRTFTSLGAHSFTEWRGLRGGRDTVREVTVLNAVPDATHHLINVEHVGPS